MIEGSRCRVRRYQRRLLLWQVANSKAKSARQYRVTQPRLHGHVSR